MKNKTLKNNQSKGFLNFFFTSKKSTQKYPTKKKPYQDYQKVYLRLIHYPGAGWLLLPPRNEMKETQQHLQIVHSQYGDQSVNIIKDMFMDMRDKSYKKLVQKHVKELQIDVPYVVVKFKYHPDTDVMEYVEEII